MVEPQRSIVRFDEASLGRDEPKRIHEKDEALAKNIQDFAPGEVLLDKADAVIDALRSFFHELAQE